MLLAFDTSTRVISLALHDGHQVLYELTWHSANNHTLELAPAIDRALRANGLQPGDLSAIAVAQGPGSFTGLRIGMAAAKGLAFAHQLPLLAVPTLDITAAGAPSFAGHLAAVLQAGRSRLCVQRYRGTPDGGWEADGAATITDWQALVSTITTPTLVCGEIDAQGRALLQSSDRPISVAAGVVGLRRAGFLAELAWHKLRAGSIEDPRGLAPIYLHQPGVPHP